MVFYGILKLIENGKAIVTIAGGEDSAPLAILDTGIDKIPQVGDNVACIGTPARGVCLGKIFTGNITSSGLDVPAENYTVYLSDDKQSNFEDSIATLNVTSTKTINLNASDVICNFTAASGSLSEKFKELQTLKDTVG